MPYIISTGRILIKLKISNSKIYLLILKIPPPIYNFALFSESWSLIFVILNPCFKSLISSISSSLKLIKNIKVLF